MFNDSWDTIEKSPELPYSLLVMSLCLVQNSLVDLESWKDGGG